MRASKVTRRGRSPWCVVHSVCSPSNYPNARLAHLPTCHTTSNKRLIPGDHFAELSLFPDRPSSSPHTILTFRELSTEVTTKESSTLSANSTLHENYLSMTMLATRSMGPRDPRDASRRSECALRVLFLVVYMVGPCLCRMPCKRDDECQYISSGRTRCWSGTDSDWTSNFYGSPGCYSNIQGYATMVCGYKCCWNTNPPYQRTDACAFPPTCVAGTSSTTGYAGMASAACVCCPAGNWSTQGATSCTSCGPGTYSIACSSSCAPCTRGTFSLEDGNPSCTVGKYMFVLLNI